MPNPSNAIPGQASLARTREKAQRVTEENYRDLPNWAKSWTPEQMETFVETAVEGITDLASAKAVLENILPKMAWMHGALRDYVLLKQEEDV